jgi:hypothetical protein
MAETMMKAITKVKRRKWMVNAVWAQVWLAKPRANRDFVLILNRFKTFKNQVLLHLWTKKCQGDLPARR